MRPRNLKTLLVILLLCTPLISAMAGEQARVTYIANSGLMIESGETRILFDPLFNYPHDYYQRVPAETESAIIAGSGEFSGVDAVFISHFHSDHFSPSLILDLLRSQTSLVLIAPGQAVSAMYNEAEDSDTELFERVRSINVGHGEAPVSLSLGEIDVEAIMIPHSGWPDHNRHVENLSYRVTLNDEVTVVHMGDADARVEHFQGQADHWSARHAHAAFPPYWFFPSKQGRRALEEHVRPDIAIGVHIPADASQRPAELHGYEVFDTPGQKRELGKD